MAFLRNLFGGGPKLPEPIRDAFHGEEALRREIAQLRDGRWRAVAARLTRTRDADDRAFVAGMMLEAGAGWIDEWHAAEPSRAEPWLMRGLSRIAWAWEARGSGRASDVPDDAWPVFFERLKLAEEDLLEAVRRNAKDALPWAYLLVTGRALEVGVEELRRRWDEGRQRAPEAWQLSWLMLEALTEKWSGSHDLMFEFAREVSSAAPEGSALHALVAEAHLQRWLHFRMEDPPDRQGELSYYRTPEVLEELRRAWARGPGSPAFRTGRFAPNQRAAFAFAFTLGGDDASARAVFDRLDRVTTEPWHHLGEPMEAFTAARRQVYR
jgi:hypothetical protein